MEARTDLAGEAAAGLIPFTERGGDAVSTALTRKALLLIAAALLSGCSDAAKSAENVAEKPGSALVGTWTDPTPDTDNRLVRLTLNADGTGVGVRRYRDQTIIPGDGRSFAGMAPTVVSKVVSKTMKLSWRVDREHFFITLKGSSDENELDYSINGNTLSYGAAGYSQRYILQRARE